METSQYLNNIQFHYSGSRLRFPSAKTKDWLFTAIQHYGFELENINYIFCSDEELLEINRDHLQHDYYTDIITFDLSDSKKVIDAEIFISVDRVKENAKNNGVSAQNELKRVMIHGLLHLVGFKDKSDKESKQMRIEESIWIDRFPRFT